MLFLSDMECHRKVLSRRVIYQLNVNRVSAGVLSRRDCRGQERKQREHLRSFYHNLGHMMVSWTRRVAAEIVTSGEIQKVEPKQSADEECERRIKDNSQVFGLNKYLSERLWWPRPCPSCCVIPLHPLSLQGRHYSPV